MPRESGEKTGVPNDRSRPRQRLSQNDGMSSELPTNARVRRAYSKQTHVQMVVFKKTIVRRSEIVPMLALELPNNFHSVDFRELPSNADSMPVYDVSASNSVIHVNIHHHYHHH